MTPDPVGYLCLVLHAHLPFIRHPEEERFLEEDWLFEGITETYVPLLESFTRLRSEGIPFRITMTLSPPLAAMLGDPLLMSRYREHLERLIELAERECGHHPETTRIGKIARMYRERFLGARRFIYETCDGTLLTSFRDLSDSGELEVITCTATHGFLPLMGDEGAKRAQIRVGVESYRRLFGRSPRGIWLGECAYDEGIDRYLAEAGVEYFFLESHGLLYGEPRPINGLHAPVITGAGVYAFARDIESSKQVWSADEGYPGDPDYREFYRDLGFDADYDYVKPYLHPDGVRRAVGIKYHRITGNVGLHEKDYYEPDWARERAAEHAGNFLFNRQAQARWLRGGMDRPPIIIAPYDAELFGHWWYEGPMFIEYLIRKTHYDQSEIALIAPGGYLDRHPVNQRQTPNPSSWGSEGHNLVWLNGSNAWIYRHQHHAERRMRELARAHPDADGLLRASLNQASRELLLAQSSDWAFIATTGTTVPYAFRRLKEHLSRFNAIDRQITEGQLDEAYIRSAEQRTPIFPWIDYRVFA